LPFLAGCGLEAGMDEAAHPRLIDADALGNLVLLQAPIDDGDAERFVHVRKSTPRNLCVNQELEAFCMTAQRTGLVHLYKPLPGNDLAQSSIEKSFSSDYRKPVAPRRIDAELDAGAFSRNFNRLFDALAAQDGVTARRFAQDINIGESEVSRWRSGSKGVPGLATMLKIAIRFGVSVDVLLAGVCPQYVTGKTVQSYTVQNSTRVTESALPAKGERAHAPSTSTAHLLQEISARQRIIDITNQQIAELASGLYTTDPKTDRTGTSKSVPRPVRRKHRG